VANEETAQERLDRELIELLNEARVALPGVQVLFAFLLAVPFQQRFKQVTTFQRDVYFATLSCTFLSTAFMIAPSALHRLNFRRHDKQRIVAISNSLMIWGLAFLGAALVLVMMLVSDVLFGATAAVVAPAIGGLILLSLWAVLPLGIRHSRDDP
jgi:predicted neutral ceramidase superfamily lipid hydrolase